LIISWHPFFFPPHIGWGNNHLCSHHVIFPCDHFSNRFSLI
jgi:hypothetical protein